jgi:5-methylcytosine-specific restriction endonuclease McrA
MTDSRPDVNLRTALWHANDKRCFYCQELVAFRDLEVDHLIAKSIEKDRLSCLLKDLSLEPSFSVDSPVNLVPTHSNCNARKSDSVFSAHNLRYFLEIWSRKQAAIAKETARLEQTASNDKLLASIASKIEKGDFTLKEVVTVLKHNVANRLGRPSEPAVVTFGMNFIESDIGPSPQAYDQLETKLMTEIGKVIPSVFAATEPSQRTGESLSVRIAFWNLDLNRLDKLDIPEWQIIEICQYSDLYSWTWEDLFPKGVVPDQPNSE